MKIPRITEVGKEQYVEGDFLDLLTANQIDWDEEDYMNALRRFYVGSDLCESMTLLEFASEFTAFGNGKYCDSILSANCDFYLIPAEMEDTDSEEAVAFFENLAEIIINGQ